MQHVWRYAVARHPVLALLDRLVEPELLLLADRVHVDLVVHRGLDVAARAQVLHPVIVEVVVPARQVGIQGVEVGGLLDAIPDACELICEMLTSGIGPATRKIKGRCDGRFRFWIGSERGEGSLGSRVEVRLDDHRQPAADHAIAVAALERGLHAAHALVGHALHETDVETDLVPLDDL